MINQRLAHFTPKPIQHVNQTDRPFTLQVLGKHATWTSKTVPANANELQLNAKCNQSTVGFTREQFQETKRATIRAALFIGSVSQSSTT
jgi:hypothetical protein